MDSLRIACVLAVVGWLLERVQSPRAAALAARLAVVLLVLVWWPVVIAALLILAVSTALGFWRWIWGHLIRRK